MDSNVFYMPGLWNGKPPMASVSPDYNKEAKEVRAFIAKQMSDENNRHCLLSIDEMFERTNVLWDAILAENFVFSFKNSLQVRAYDSLEIEVSQRMLEFQKLDPIQKCGL